MEYHVFGFVMLKTQKSLFKYLTDTKRRKSVNLNQANAATRHKIKMSYQDDEQHNTVTLRWKNHRQNTKEKLNLCENHLFK